MKFEWFIIGISVLVTYYSFLGVSFILSKHLKMF